MATTRSRPNLRIDPRVEAQHGPYTAQPRSRAIAEDGSESAPYPHVTICRSSHMEIHIQSQSVESRPHTELELTRTRPVFTTQDTVGGFVILGSNCEHSGKLTISIEGSFTFVRPKEPVLSAGPSGQRKQTFFTDSVGISVSASSENGSPRSVFREAFSPGRKRSGSSSSSRILQARNPRSFPFRFPFPQPKEADQRLPESFSVSAVVSSGIRARSFVEAADVSFKVTALWEPTHDLENRAKLEAPILVRAAAPDSLTKSDRWIEMPFKSHDSDLFTCAVTLPDPARFARNGFIPFYVVFSASPLFTHLAREIAIDSIISISVVREVTISDAPSLPPTPPRTPSPTRNDHDATSLASPLHKSRSRRVLRRLTQSAPLNAQSNKSTTDLSNTTTSKGARRRLEPSFETRSIYSDIRTGFPKRARRRDDLARDARRLPDGLYKSHVLLSDDILPSVSWAGTSIRYFLDISVAYKSFSVSARVPIQIF